MLERGSSNSQRYNVIIDNQRSEVVSHVQQSLHQVSVLHLSSHTQELQGQEQPEVI